MTLTILGAAVFAAGEARGDGERDKAVEHFRQGKRLYQVSEYRSALDEFKRAFLLKEDPVFLFNIAQCHRQLGDRKDAITYYKRYLAADPSAANRDQVEKIVRDLGASSGAERSPSAAAATEAQSRSPDAVVPSAGQPAGAPFPLAAPPAHGHSGAMESALSARPPADRSASPAPVYQRWWFWTVVGSVVAASVAGGLVISSPGRGDPPCPPGVKC